jgi:hypothetical protein
VHDRAPVRVDAHDSQVMGRRQCWGGSARGPFASAAAAGDCCCCCCCCCPAPTGLPCLREDQPDPGGAAAK